MRIALIADTHLSARSPECVANWHAARRAVMRLSADLTIHLGDITLDGQTHTEELAFASRLIEQWPTEMRCVPGNHDLGDGSGERPLSVGLLDAYAKVFGADRWAVRAGNWQMLGINAQLLGSGAEQELALWRWIDDQASSRGSASVHTALFLHRPAWRPSSGELPRKGRYVPREAAERLLMGALQPTRLRIGRWDLVLRLALIVPWDILKSNAAIAWSILTNGQGGKRQSGFVRIPLTLRSPAGLGMLSIIVSATPGTAWLEHDQESGLLLLHVFNLNGPCIFQ